MNKQDIILAIESSCDDTSIAICCDGEIMINIVESQAIHRKYGGILPEHASRLHIECIIAVLDKALQKSGLTLNDITHFAYTAKPGLVGSLLVGGSVAKTLSVIYNKPLYAVNHIEAHVLSILIEHKNVSFPLLALSVSGGHTQIILSKHPHHFEIIGETLDDSAGEAFDKIARMLGLDYPGGVYIDKLSQTGDANKFKFNAGKVNDFNFSFSGLKTNVLYFLNDQKKKNALFINENLNDLCASVQKTIIDNLLSVFYKSIKAYKISNIAIVGGVSANSYFKQEAKVLAEKHNLNLFIPALQYSTDNAAMIAIAAYYQYIKPITSVS